MLPVLQPAQLGRELAACTILGAAVGVVRAFFPVRGRGAFVPDALLTGAANFNLSSIHAVTASFVLTASSFVLQKILKSSAYRMICISFISVFFIIL